MLLAVLVLTFGPRLANLNAHTFQLAVGILLLFGLAVLTLVFLARKARR